MLVPAVVLPVAWAVVTMLRLMNIRRRNEARRRRLQHIASGFPKSMLISVSPYIWSLHLKTLGMEGWITTSPWDTLPSAGVRKMEG